MNCGDIGSPPVWRGPCRWAPKAEFIVLLRTPGCAPLFAKFVVTRWMSCCEIESAAESIVLLLWVC